MDKIENIQKKPDYIKRRILFVVVAVIMFIVVAVWVSTLNITMGVGENRANDGVPAPPFAVIKDIARQSFAKFNFLDFNK